MYINLNVMSADCVIIIYAVVCIFRLVHSCLMYWGVLFFVDEFFNLHSLDLYIFQGVIFNLKSLYNTNRLYGDVAVGENYRWQCELLSNWHSAWELRSNIG